MTVCQARIKVCLKKISFWHMHNWNTLTVFRLRPQHHNSLYTMISVTAQEPNLPIYDSVTDLTGVWWSRCQSTSNIWTMYYRSVAEQWRQTLKWKITLVLLRLISPTCVFLLSQIPWLLHCVFNPHVFLSLDRVMLSLCCMFVSCSC